jgi:hypothetical protein
MMRVLRQLFAMIALMPLSLMAQEAETASFTSDLFGGITGVDILPKGRLQWETFAFYEHSTMYDYDSKTWSPNTSVLRYGISNSTELSLQGAWFHTTDEDEKYSGFGDLVVGVKTRLFEGWKAVPAISLRGLLYFPGGENDYFLPDNFSYQLDLIFYNPLTSWCALGYMGTMIWDDLPKPTVVFGGYLDFFLTDRLTFSVEERNCRYGFEEENYLDTWAGLTLSYQLLPRVELGLTSDISLRYPKDFFNLSLGVAWQLTKK